MTTFDSTKLPLKDLLKDVVQGKIQLPDFQRGWVWDDEHVRSLLVSLGRSFPVGAVMLLETGGEVRFQVRRPDAQLHGDQAPRSRRRSGRHGGLAGGPGSELCDRGDAYDRWCVWSMRWRRLR